MRWRLLVLGFAIYAAGLAAMAPATLLDARVERASGGRIRLAEARGTLWSGTAVVEVLDGAGRAEFAAPVAWRIGARSLLRARLVYGVAVGSPASRFTVAISPREIELENVDLRLPAAALGLGAPKLAVLGPTGAVRLHVARLAAGARRVEGGATLEWRNAGSALTPVAPLGDYELRIQGEGRSVRATLRTLKGPLRLEGGGAWVLGTRPALTATAEVGPRYRAQLAPLLGLIGVEQGAGRYALRL